MKQGGNPSAGFTIVETLIVLAVTAGLLISTLTLISGRQVRTQFQTSVGGLQQNLQQTIGEVQKGFYPNNNSFRCNGAVTPVVFSTAAGTEQGSNSGCIFVGKVVGGFSAASKTYDVVPVGGNQFSLGLSTTITNLTQAKPVAALTLKQSPTWGGLDFVKAYYNGNPAQAVTAFGVFSGDDTGSFATTALTGGLNSGGQTFSLYAVLGSACISPTPVGSVALKDYPVAAAVPSSCIKNVSSVSICLAGGAHSSALLTIGGSGGLDVSQRSFSGGTCG